MPTASRSVFHGFVLAAHLLMVHVLLAQEPIAVPPASPEFLSRFDYGVSLETLGSRDPRFSWDGRATADFDVMDYVKGRTSFLAQYEVLMGNQLRPFDPNQGNYTLEGSSSLRIHRTEIAALFHHLSRHLSDRQNFQSISFNSLGGRVMRHFDSDKMTVDLRGELAKVVRHEFLDYSWTSRLHIIVRRPLTSRLGAFGMAQFESYGTDPAIAHRGQQNGGRIEAGLRLNGARGAAEFFTGWEQRIDAYPVERRQQRWSFLGLRLTGK